MTESHRKDAVAGVLYGLAAYGSWGFLAVYFKWVASVHPLEILAHRIVWSVAVLAILITASRGWPAMRAIAGHGRSLRFLAITTCLIATNWYIFIWAVTRDHMVEASLGYFMNPLVNVLLGFFFLREHLRRWEWVSVAIAGLAVAWLVLAAGVFPWISLTLAVSFGMYGLLRKIAGVASIGGLAIETAILLPFAAAYLVMRARDGSLAFGHVSTSLDLLLLAAGPFTALPLLWFASAVRRLRLATVGLLQYIAPSIQFTLAVAVYHEPFDRTRMIAFILIWIAIAIYSVDNFRKRNVPRVTRPA
ncbi:MAG TPA: EamA family transporter RarD [Thermoanaerobaculia bacterium]|nr:EamA family transporter RarD [Thermoanaerobaculia bacterium]